MHCINDTCQFAGDNDTDNGDDDDNDDVMNGDDDNDIHKNAVINTDGKKLTITFSLDGGY